MAVRTYGHTRTTNGKVKVVAHRVPKGMRGIDPGWDVHTFREGPLRRLFSRR